MKYLILVLCLICLAQPISYAITQDFEKIKQISDEVVKDCINDSEKVLALSHYVYLKLKPDYSKGIPPNATMSVTDRLESGVGWCNHQVQVFMFLAQAQGIKTRMLYLLNKAGDSSPHTIGEAFVSGRWVVVDPQLDFNVLVTREEIQKNPEIIKNLPLMLKRKEEVYNNDESKYDEWIALYYNPSILVGEM